MDLIYGERGGGREQANKMASPRLGRVTPGDYSFGVSFDAAFVVSYNPVPILRNLR